MRIAGRLSDTTLGDVLGTLRRARVTGLVRLTETAGPTAGRTHCIYLSQGLVVAVDTQAILMPLGEILRQKGLLDGAADRHLTMRLASSAMRTGDILVQERLIAPAILGAALRQQVRIRLEALFRLVEASISFHVACPPPRGAVVPLAPDEYLRGRPRARDRVRSAGPQHRANPVSPTGRAEPAWRIEALRVLGLSQAADTAEVTRAFRRLARSFHPDGFAQASEAERKAAERRFATLSAAYHSLLG